MTRKLGRLPRAHNSSIPHMSALMAGKPVPVLPPTVDNASALPADGLGQMLNDTLGDCTCAAVYHAIQVWTAAARGVEITEPDSDVQALYEQACGYNPADPNTDQGGVEQDVLTFLLKTGAPIQPSPAPRVRHLIAAFVEVDPRMLDDVRAAIYECGVSYIGFNVPAYIMAQEPPAVWDVDPSADNSIVGGHAVVLTGYDASGFDFISWGKKYRMTFAFFAKFTDESYAIADPSWIEATGKTPGGLTPAALEAQMAALKAGA